MRRNPEIVSLGPGAAYAAAGVTPNSAATERRDALTSKLEPILGQPLAYEVASNYVQAMMDEPDDPDVLEEFLRQRQRHPAVYRADHLTDGKIAEARRVLMRKELAPNRSIGLYNARRAFDKCFDIVEARFPDFGECELHEDERAGSDNGAGSERQFGYCKDGQPIIIAFAAKVEQLPEHNIRGLMRHEFGHALDFRYGRRPLEKVLGVKLSPMTERRADQIAEAVFGEPIEYDQKLIQCVDCGGVSPRPRRLPR